MTVADQNANPDNGQAQQQANNAPAGNYGGRQLATTTPDNLKVGTTITAMGTLNADGSLAATRIMIGGFGGGNRGANASSTPNGGQGRRGGNFGRASSTPGAVNGQNLTRVSGDIATVTGNTLTVKIADGSSKTVSFTDQTSIIAAGQRGGSQGGQPGQGNGGQPNPIDNGGQPGPGGDQPLQ